MSIRERGSIIPEQANWKAGESMAIEQNKKKNEETLTPEALIDQIPESERYSLKGLGEKIFGKEAVAEVAHAIKNQVALLKEFGTGIKSPIEWKNIDKRKALVYGTYILVGAVAHELSSASDAEAEEVSNHHQELMHVMGDHMPENEGGERLTLDQLSSSQKVGVSSTYDLLKVYEKDGGAPADFEIQVDDIWRVQQELVDIKYHDQKDRDEDFRATDLAHWATTVNEQYEMQKDFNEQDKDIVDKAMGIVDNKEDIGARDRLLFKGAVLEAIHQSKNGKMHLNETIDNLLRITEDIKARPIYSPDDERAILQHHYDEILHVGLQLKPDVKVGAIEQNLIKPVQEEMRVAEVESTKHKLTTQEIQDQNTGVGHEFFGIVLPEHMELHFSNIYSADEQSAIQKFVDHEIATMQEVAHQFNTWQEKYGQKQNFASFQEKIKVYIQDTTERVNHIAADVKNSNVNKIDMSGSIMSSPAETAKIILEGQSSLMHLRTTQEAADDNFEQM